MSTSTVAGPLSRPGLPGLASDAAARSVVSHPDPAVRAAAAGSAATPAAVLLELADSNAMVVLEAAARNRYCPPELLERFAASGQLLLRCLAAQHPGCPAQVLVRLADDSDCDVRWALALNPSCPEEALLAVAGHDDPSVLQTLAENRASSAAVLERVAVHPYREVRAAVRRHPNCPPRWASPPRRAPARAHYSKEELADPDCDPAVLADAGRSPLTPPRDAAARHPSTPPESLRRLARRGQYAAALVAYNPSCPADLLLELATHNKSWVRRNAAGNLRLRPKTRRELARDPDDIVRGAVAASDACPAGMLRQLAKDPEPRVRASVAENTACPPETLERLAGDSDLDARAAVASNPSCPEPLMVKLAADPDGRARRSVAQNPACPDKLLVQLAEDPAPAVRHAVALHPGCPRSLLLRIAASPDLARCGLVAATAHGTGHPRAETFGPDDDYARRFCCPSVDVWEAHTHRLCGLIVEDSGLSCLSDTDHTGSCNDQ